MLFPAVRFIVTPVKLLHCIPEEVDSVYKIFYTLFLPVPFILSEIAISLF